MENGVIINGIGYEVIAFENEDGKRSCEDCDLRDTYFCEHSADCIADILMEEEKEDDGKFNVFQRVQPLVEKFARKNLGKETEYKFGHLKSGMIVGYNVKGRAIIVSFTDNTSWSDLDEDDIILLRSPLNMSYEYVSFGDSLLKRNESCI